MAISSGCTSRDNDLISSLILFACTAKLWLLLAEKNQNKRHRKNIHFNDVVDPLHQPLAAFILSPFQSTLKLSRRRNHTVGEEERQRRILLREDTYDFHPKNRNWNHFENSTPPSPIRLAARVIAEEENDDSVTNSEEEDFLWSEPPSLLLNGKGETNNDADSEYHHHHQYSYTDNSLKSNSTKHRKSSNKDSILHFNAGCLPSKLIMIRHGQSEGNVDELLYATKPDNTMRLTKLGWEMTKMAGVALREQLPPNESVHFIVSPYARTVETFHGIVSAWSDPDKDFGHISNRSKRLKAWYTQLTDMGLTWHEDPRIREQDFGNYQDPKVIKKAKSERHKFGSFYYRFPHGESASDVFDRVSTFLDSLWRSFASGRAQNYVIVAHGVSIRVFLARYFRYSIDQFHMLANPKNCEMIMLAHNGLGRLKLDGRCELELEEKKKEDDQVKGDNKNDDDETVVVTGYKKYSRLRTLPPQWVRPRTIRMSYNDT